MKIKQLLSWDHLFLIFEYLVC